MRYGFDTDDIDEATAALLVYAAWRSRSARYKITPEVWGQVERFTKAAAKRATSIPRFIEQLKPKLYIQTLSPRAMEVGIRGTIPMVEAADGTFLQLGPQEGQREFLTGVLKACDERRVLDILYRETSWVILLVRDRLERERPVEARMQTILNEINGAGDAP